MTMYLVSYSLTPKRDIDALLNEFQSSLGWAHYVDESWLIATHETVQQLYERLAKHFQRSDRLLIMQVQPTSQYQGWLPKEFWDWIERYKYS
ncbi:MAG: hypothetical protein HY687_02640 [Chloroflexi bacterium]|nr:hypothetical protein [Chloroflexota bacterium]